MAAILSRPQCVNGFVLPRDMDIFVKADAYAYVMYSHDDIIKWKHFQRYWPLCGEFTSDRCFL